MLREHVLRQLQEHRRELDHFRVKSLGLFGSVARGEEGPDSDVDILVEFDGPATFDDYMGLKLLLEDLLGRRVDLVTPKAVRPRLLELIEREVIHAA